MDIGAEKWDGAEKVDIESLFSDKTEGFSDKTVLHIKLYMRVLATTSFGRNAVMELLGLKSSGASKLISIWCRWALLSLYQVMEKENIDSKFNQNWRHRESSIKVFRRHCLILT